MKTIYEVRPLAEGKLNADLYKMIALHNSGSKGNLISFDLLEAWIKADGGETKRDEEFLFVSENGTHTMTIRELSFIGEVSETESNLINLENLS